MKIINILVKISNLIIDVEDNYTSIFKFKSKLKNISLAKVTCSYVQVPKKRTIFISCELGSLYADLNNLKIKILKNNKKEIIKKFNFDKNKMFIDEIKYFLKLIKKKIQKKFFLIF